MLIASTSLVQVVSATAPRQVVGDMVQWVLKAQKRPDETWMQFLNSETNRPKVLRFVWIATILCGLVLTAIVLFGLHALTGVYKPGIGCTVVLWAIIFGITGIVFLPSRLLTAIFGGVLGIGLDEAATDFSGLINKAAISVDHLATSLLTIVGPSLRNEIEFTKWMMWLFIAIIALFCLPAFFKE